MPIFIYSWGTQVNRYAGTPDIYLFICKHFWDISLMVQIPSPISVGNVPRFPDVLTCRHHFWRLQYGSSDSRVFSPFVCSRWKKPGSKCLGHAFEDPLMFGLMLELQVVTIPPVLLFRGASGRVGPWGLLVWLVGRITSTCHKVHF